MGYYRPWSYKHQLLIVLPFRVEILRDRRLELLGKNIRRKRKEQNLSQEALAYEAGIDRAYLGKIERGEKNITVLKLLQICDTLKISVRELF